MADFTEKQSQFIANKVAGMQNRDAAIAAGYSERSADTQAGKLMMRDDITDAIGLARGDAADDSDDAGMRTDYPDSLSFLQDAYNNPKLSKSMRLSAAVAALPYEHAKLGEQGKKEKAKDRAREASQRPKFAAKHPPTLRAIDGGKSTE